MSNWGHFDLDPKLYPSGWDAIRTISGKSAGKGTRLTMYTLTNFLKPKAGLPEPFITPHVYPRYRKDLPDVGSRTDFTVTCQFGAPNSSKEPVAFLNVLHSEIITVPKKKQ